jgi:hypothetical protein
MAPPTDVTAVPAADLPADVIPITRDVGIFIVSQEYIAINHQ